MNDCRIILADDHEILREGLRSLIQKEKGFRVVGEAPDGVSLLALMKKTRCDVVVLDLYMPNMDGMAAIKHIRECCPAVKILILTMLKDHEHFRRAMANGAQGYLIKDEAFDQLIVAVRSVMKGKQFVSPSVAALLADRYVRSLEEADAPSLDILTKREIQILKLIARGAPNKNIAAELGLSVRTVETHRSNLSSKLGVKTTAGLVKFAMSKGLLQILFCAVVVSGFV
jgi:two-component system nitrate/nitrite response regulator NarL